MCDPEEARDVRQNRTPQARQMIAWFTLLSCAFIGFGCASANRDRVSVLTAHQQIVWEPESTQHPSSLSVVPATRRDLSLQKQPDGTWIFESASQSASQSASIPAKQSGGFSFDLLLLSWNLGFDPGAGAIVELRVGPTESGGWSPYLQVGTCGIADGRPNAVREFSESGRVCGKIVVDQFVSEKQYSAFEVRIKAVSDAPQSNTPPIRIERLAIWRGDSTSKRSIRISELIGDSDRIQAYAKVPFRPQRTAVASLSGRLCSPTSLSMVLEYYGANRELLEVAQRVRDPDFDLYGNWPRNIQVAFECGVPGYLTRFSSWQPVVRLLADGHPIIASIAAPKGVLRNAPYTELNDGHLIVLTGTDGNGGVYVNDPAATDAAGGQRIYSMTDLSKAWLELGKGTGYVLLGDPPHASQVRSEGNE